MKSKWLYILLAVIFHTACQNDVELTSVCTTECSKIPVAVASASWFEYDSVAYIFGGRTNSGLHTNNLWKYTPSTDNWTLIDNTPLKARVSSSACVVGDLVYIGLGFAGPVHHDASYLHDFWSYNPRTKEWKRLADFPANTTVKNCLFGTDDAIYAAYGFYRQFTQDVYRYDILKNQWTKLECTASRTVPRAMDVVGATCQGRHFLGTGFNHNSLRFWAEWDPEQQHWTTREKILGSGRNATACCATNEYVYLVGGRHYGDTLTTGFFYSSIQRYSPSKDEWEYVGSMPYEAENMVAINIKGQIFIGLGETQNGKIQDCWYKFEE